MLQPLGTEPKLNAIVQSRSHVPADFPRRDHLYCAGGVLREALLLHVCGHSEDLAARSRLQQLTIQLHQPHLGGGLLRDLFLWRLAGIDTIWNFQDHRSSLPGLCDRFLVGRERDPCSTGAVSKLEGTQMFSTWCRVKPLTSRWPGRTSLALLGRSCYPLPAQLAIATCYCAKIA